MLIESMIALFLGVLAGTFTGLFPGIHVNLVAVFLLAASPALIKITTPLVLVIFIVAMSITHSFLDFIPSIYLGAPDEDSFLSVLPGHQLLKEGNGHEAVVLTLYGSLTALVIILIFTPIFIFLFPIIQNAITSLIPFLLIFISLFLIFREEEYLLSLTVFALAGFLGLLTFSLPIKEPLLPLLTGLFGASALIISLKNPDSKLPNQNILPLKKIKLAKKSVFQSIFASALTAPLCSFLPGIGSGHAAVIASELTEQNPRSFLFLIGAINTVVIAMSFIAIYAINKTRSGVAVAVNEILQKISLTDLAIIILTIIVSSLISFFLGVQLSKLAARHIHKINYKTLSLSTLIILFIVNFIFTNLLGLLVLATSTSLGVFAILSNSRRINLMASLLIPTIVFHLSL